MFELPNEMTQQYSAAWNITSNWLDNHVSTTNNDATAAAADDDEWRRGDWWTLADFRMQLNVTATY